MPTEGNSAFRTVLITSSDDFAKHFPIRKATFHEKKPLVKNGIDVTIVFT